MARKTPKRKVKAAKKPKRKVKRVARDKTRVVPPAKDPVTGHFLPGNSGGAGRPKGGTEGIRSLRALYGETAQEMVDKGEIKRLLLDEMRKDKAGIAWLLKNIFGPQIDALNRREGPPAIDIHVAIGKARTDAPEGYASEGSD